MIKSNIKTILSEINQVFTTIDEQEVNKLIDLILNSKTIVTLGAGRVGLVCRSFSMRLAHMGLSAYHIHDSVVPFITKNDLLFICSGSGETQTIFDLALIAKTKGARLSLITCNPNSRMGVLADTIVTLNSPSKESNKGIKTIQPMTSLTEQSFYILTDALVLSLMKKLKQTHETMLKRHSILE